MKQPTYLGIPLVLVLSACVSTNADVPRGHPANPTSPSAPLALTPVLTAVAAANTDAEAADPHGMEGMSHHHHRDAVAPPTSSAEPARGASKEGDSPAAAEVWTCSMHPQVTKSGPGKCPICGMNLIKRLAGKDAK